MADFASSATRRDTRRRASGATTVTTGKAMAQAVSQLEIQIQKNPSTRPRARKVETPEMMKDIMQESVAAKR